MSPLIICGTGHRPDKLGGYSEEVSNRLIAIAEDWLAGCVDRGPSPQVISGGALGWDQALAWASLNLKLSLTMAMPFSGFWSRWPKKSQDELELLASMADRVVYVCEEGYAPWKMQTRNEWMVDNSDLVLALWNGTPGGTANCIRYAEKVGKPIKNLWESYEQR